MKLLVPSLLILLLTACGAPKPKPQLIGRERPTGVQARAAIHDRMAMNEFTLYKNEFSNFPPDVSSNDRSSVYHFIDGTLTIWWKPNKNDRFASMDNVQFIDHR